MEIIICDTASLSYERLKSLPFVTAEDISAADRFVRDGDKVLHLVSACLKRKYIGEWKKNEYGKPLAKKVFFNVSHTENAVAIAISDGCDVGLDIERIRPIKDEVKRFVSSEAERIADMTDEEFFLMWTAKESLVKAEGKGFGGHPRSVPSRPFEGVKEWNGQIYRSRYYILGGDVAVSVTGKGAAPFECIFTKESLI